MPEGGLCSRPQLTQIGPPTGSWQAGQFPKDIGGASSGAGAGVAGDALSRGAQSVNESPQEQERFDSGLRNTKPVFTMVFSKSSSEPLMNR